MSAIGTSVAAGVAQTSLQAQQVARHRDRQRRTAATDADRMLEQYESHLLAPEEPEAESPAQLHIDGQLPEHQQSSYQPAAAPAPPPDDTQTPPPPPPPPPPVINAGEELYHHVDLKV